MPVSQKTKLVLKGKKTTTKKDVVVEYVVERSLGSVYLMAYVDGERWYVAGLDERGMKLISYPTLPDEMMDGSYIKVRK